MYSCAPILRIPWRTCPMKRRTDAKGREHSRTGAERLTGTRDRDTWEPGAEGLTGLFRRAM